MTTTRGTTSTTTSTTPAPTTHGATAEQAAAEVTAEITAEVAAATAVADLAQARADRYVDSIVQLHRRLTYGGLVTALQGTQAYVARHGYGITTVAARTADIPHRYLLGIAGFRLAQYLQIGYASSQVAVAKALFSETVGDFGPNDVHCLALDEHTGAILGYVALAGNHGDPEHPAADPRRNPFPVEVAHRIDLLSTAGVATPELRCGEIREIKRFVQSRTLHDRQFRFRVSLELLLALTRVIEHSEPHAQVLIGDVEAHVALRHLLLMGLQVTLVQGTAPTLPATDVNHGLYTVRDKVEPFLATVPDPAEVTRRGDIVERVATSADLFAAAGALLQEMAGDVAHLDVSAQVPA